MRKNYPRNFIREVRENKGLSSDELGQLVGCTGAHILLLETSQRRIYHDLVQRIAHALGCNEFDLIYGPGNRIVTECDIERDVLLNLRALDANARLMAAAGLKALADQQKTARQGESTTESENAHVDGRQPPITATSRFP
jgi:transcriptional regulator with XRE-family HTH domain